MPGPTNLTASADGEREETPIAHKVHPLAWINTLYMAESLPFAAVVMVSALMYKSFRTEFPWLTDGKIAFYTAWLGLPWSLKPFWSPFLELYKSKKHLVVLTQAIGAGLFALLALTIKAPQVVQMTWGAFFILAFVSATHDIVADGIYMDSLTSKEQAKYVGFQSAFWTLGSVLAAGAFLKLAGALEKSLGIRPAWMAFMGALALFMVLLSGYHAKFLPSGKPGSSTARNAGEIFANFKKITLAFFLKKNIAWMIVFTLLYRFAEAQVSKIAPLFMRTDRAAGGLGLSTEDVALIYGTFATIAFVLGSVVGGAWTAKKGLKPALPYLVVAFNLPNALFTLLAFTQPTSFILITLSASVEKFALGFGQVALILYMMQQLAPGKFRMAHYGFATALMNLGVMVPGMISGTISDLVGYKFFFVYVLVAAAPSFLVALMVPFRQVTEDDPDEDPDRTTRKPAVLAPILLGIGLLLVVGTSTYLQFRGQ